MFFRFCFYKSTTPKTAVNSLNFSKFTVAELLIWLAIARKQGISLPQFMQFLQYSKCLRMISLKFFDRTYSPHCTGSTPLFWKGCLSLEKKISSQFRNLKYAVLWSRFFCLYIIGIKKGLISPALKEKQNILLFLNERIWHKACAKQFSHAEVFSNL